MPLISLHSPVPLGALETGKVAELINGRLIAPTAVGPEPAWTVGMARRVVQLVSFGAQLVSQPAKLFLGEQIETFAARFAAPGRKVAEIAGGHSWATLNRRLR